MGCSQNRVVVGVGFISPHLLLTLFTSCISVPHPVLLSSVIPFPATRCLPPCLQALGKVMGSELPHISGGSGRVLYPASAKASTDLQDSLTAAGFEVHRINTYNTVRQRGGREDTGWGWGQLIVWRRNILNYIQGIPCLPVVCHVLCLLELQPALFTHTPWFFHFCPHHNPTKHTRPSRGPSNLSRRTCFGRPSPLMW